MKKLSKRTIALVLSLLFVLSAAVPALAAGKVTTQKEDLKATQKEDLKAKNPTYEDVIALDPYVSVVKGQYVIDKKAAQAAGISKELIDSQAEYIKTINKEAKDGLITIKESKEFEVVSSDSTFAVVALENHHEGEQAQGCRGGRNSTNFCWWGVKRFACDCETKRIASIFKWCSVGAGLVSMVMSVFQLAYPVAKGVLDFGAWYWSLLADKMNAKNYGRGVQVNLTWVLAFATYAQ